MIKALLKILLYSPFYFLSTKIAYKTFILTARQVFIVKSVGTGKLVVGDKTTIGNSSSPGFFSYSYLDIRRASAGIIIGESTVIGNRISIISNHRVSIGSKCLIGNDVKIYDTDFHSIDKNRKSENSLGGDVHIGENVFIGDNVVILKGVCIGDNSVIGAGSVVTKCFSDNTIIAGNPARGIGSVT